MMWHLVRQVIPYLSKPFQEAKKEFLKVITGEIIGFIICNISYIYLLVCHKCRICLLQG